MDIGQPDFKLAFMTKHSIIDKCELNYCNILNNVFTLTKETK